MIYLIEIYRSGNGNAQWRIYETNTGSSIQLRIEDMKKLIKENKINVKNIIMDSKSGIVDYAWPHKPMTRSMMNDTGPRMVLVSKFNDNLFELVSYTGTSSYVDAEALKMYIESDDIANCDFKTVNGETVYRSIDTSNIIKDEAYEKHIADQYKQFIIKANALCLDMSFDYYIEGHQVKVVKYTGTSKKVVMPNFVTTIMKSAFRNRGIRDLKLNDSLKYIGNSAFADNNIQYVELPKSVEIVFNNAFQNCGQVKLLNNKTLILGEI